jgi:catechol 2,3-dioxygenase-like lactoylglutathione lyase family enzyme
MHLNLINLKVQDWDRMVRWYQDVLGLTAVYLEPHDKYGHLHAGDIRLSLSSGGVLAEPLPILRPAIGNL